jgi:vacuolar protein sorting-associated protein 45
VLTLPSPEVQNVYTEHKPLLKRLLDLVFAGKLPEETFPYAKIDNRSETHSAQAPPREVIVFILGGCTYEEALCVHEFNVQHKHGAESASAGAAGAAAEKRGPKVGVVLGGTTIHNSTSFMADLQALQELA